MTDGVVSQIATVVPALPNPDAVVSQIAVIALTKETAFDGLVNQIAIVTVGNEYVIPLHLHGWLIRSIQGMGLIIEE